MKLQWRIFTNCSSEEAARKVAQKLFEKADIVSSSHTVTPYHKGGFEISAYTEDEVNVWPEFVFMSLVVAQRTGNAWQLNGNIAEELDAWSNSSVVAGINSIHIQALRHA